MDAAWRAAVVAERASMPRLWCSDARQIDGETEDAQLHQQRSAGEVGDDDGDV